MAQCLFCRTELPEDSSFDSCVECDDAAEGNRDL